VGYGTLETCRHSHCHPKPPGIEPCPVPPGARPSVRPAPHRLEKDRIVASGPANGVGIDVQGETESITLAENRLRETRKPPSRVGIRIGARTRDVRLIDNTREGFPADLSDLRKP